MINEIKRLNYFLGQFLEAEDFKNEQEYHIYMRRRLNTALRSPGILDGGFDVTVTQAQGTDPAKITVGAGLGVDNQGRELILLSAVETAIPDEFFTKTVAIYLVYGEEYRDNKIADQEASGNTRITEKPIVTLKLTTEQPPDDSILLAKITVDATGKISNPDKDGRLLSDTKFPHNVTIGTGVWGSLKVRHIDGKHWLNDNDDPLYLNHGTEKPVYVGFGGANGELKSSLCVSGNVGIGTLNPTERLEVTGNIVLAAPDKEIYQIGFQRIDEDERFHKWAFWHMNSHYGQNDLQLWEYKKDSQGVACGGNTNDGAMCNQRLTIKQGGNVGIGTTTPNGKLDVFTGGTGDWNRFVVNTTAQWGDGNNQFVTIGAGGASGIMLNNPHVPWIAAENRASIRLGRSGGVSTGSYWDIGTRAGNAFSILCNNSVLGLHITENGSIGIGTITPAVKLEVMDTVIGLATGLRFSGQHTPGITAGGVVNSCDSEGTVRPLTLQSNGGNVGIGTTNPRGQIKQSLLDVQGGAFINGVAIGVDPPTPLPASGLKDVVFPYPSETIGTVDSRWNLRLHSYNSILLHSGNVQSPILSINTNGNVGIGSNLTNPAAKLSVVASGATEIAGTAQSTTFRTSAGSLGATAASEIALASIGFLAGGNNTSLGIRAHRFSAGSDWTTAAIGLGIDVDNSIRPNDASLWLHPTGRIGISISNPQAKLHVNGDTRIDGALDFGGQESQIINVWNAAYGIGVQDYTQYFRTARNFAWYKGGVHTNEELSSGPREDEGIVQMVINDGNVGIGMKNPTHPLHVKTDWGFLALDTNAVKQDSGLRLMEGGVLKWHIYNNANGAKFYIWRDGLSTPSLIIDQTGNIGIGTTTPEATLHLVDLAGGQARIRLDNNNGHNAALNRWENRLEIASSDQITYGIGGLGGDSTEVLAVGLYGIQLKIGTALKPNGGAWGVWSDERLKQNITPLTETLDQLLKLRGVIFEWKQPEKHGNLTGLQRGFIAQEVEQVFPEWVGEDSDGYKILTIYGFEALAIEAFREMKVENNKLKQRIQNLEQASRF